MDADDTVSELNNRFEDAVGFRCHEDVRATVIFEQLVKEHGRARVLRAFDGFLEEISKSVRSRVGDGKGDLAGSMGLKMSDWHDASTLAAMSDGDIFDLIMKGKGKMTGEGDRVSREMAWKLVNYVRSFAKKETTAVPNTAGSTETRAVTSSLPMGKH